MEWRRENDGGYYALTEKWFNEYVLLVAIHKKYLSHEQISEYKKEPTILPVWDPMGTVTCECIHS